MGVWSTSLYGNDVTADVRDTYMNAIRTKESDEEAIEATLQACREYMDTDEECLVWFALADILWKNGRLSEEVKNHALHFIEQQAGKEWFEEKIQKKWLNTLNKLENQLSEPMKAYKHYKKEIYGQLKLWEIGDVYAYKFSTKCSKESELYGKYILMQKVDEIDGLDNKRFSVLHIFDKLFDKIPTIDVIKGIRLLPLCPSHYKSEEYVRMFPLTMSAVMEYIKPSEYPKSRLTYLGKADITAKTLIYRNRSDYSWYRLEENWLCSFFLDWQGIDYVREDNEYYLAKEYHDFSV